MGNLTTWLATVLAGALGALFVALFSYLSGKYLKQTEYDREDERREAEANLKRGELESRRIDSVIDGLRRLAESLEANLRQRDAEISKLRSDSWSLWQKAEEALKSAEECRLANSVLQREKDVLVRRVAALELQISDLANKIDSQ